MRRVPGATAVAGCAIVATLASTAGPSAAAQTGRTLTLYSVATAEQYVNNSDDRQRGKGDNPFGNFHDATATSRTQGNGPFPGDEAMFHFAVYTEGNLKQKAGTATYTCLYNFDKNAFCNAVYSLQDGTLVGAGDFNFNANSFAIAITGGTGKYDGLRGDLQASPGPRHSQHLVITLR